MPDSTYITTPDSERFDAMEPTAALEAAFREYEAECESAMCSEHEEAEHLMIEVLRATERMFPRPEEDDDYCGDFEYNAWLHSPSRTGIYPTL